VEAFYVKLFYDSGSHMRETVSELFVVVEMTLEEVFLLEV
jgi:hypothetical protein